MFETDWAANLRARKDADRLDLKGLVRSFARIDTLVGERFLGVLRSGDDDMGVSTS